MFQRDECYDGDVGSQRIGHWRHGARPAEADLRQEEVVAPRPSYQQFDQASHTIEIEMHADPPMRRKNMRKQGCRGRFRRAAGDADERGLARQASASRLPATPFQRQHAHRLHGLAQPAGEGPFLGGILNLHVRQIGHLSVGDTGVVTGTHAFGKPLPAQIRGRCRGAGRVRYLCSRRKFAASENTCANIVSVSRPVFVL